MDCKVDNIVLSTAAFCLWNITPDKKIGIAKQLDFSKIQIALSTEKMVHTFNAYLQSSNGLNAFKNVVIHAPWCNMFYGDSLKSKRIINGIKCIMKMIPIESVIFRVDCVPTIDVLESLIASGLPICLENSEKDMDFKLFKYYAENSQVPLALNINRAVRDNGSVEMLFNEYNRRITRVLISGFTSEMGRMPLISTRQYEILRPIRGYDGPLVIEGLFNPDDIDAIIKERSNVLDYMNWNEIA